MRLLQCWIPVLSTHGALTFLTDSLISWYLGHGTLTHCLINWIEQRNYNSRCWFFLFCPQHLWEGDSPPISCQLSSGAFSSKSSNEISGVVTQGLWLLQYTAEEIGPSTYRFSVWGARGAAHCPEEHQLNFPENVGIQMISSVLNWGSWMPLIV